MTTAATQETKAPAPPEQAPNGQALQLGSAGAKGAAMEVGSRGLQLSNLDDAWRFCTAMAASGMMPKGMETAQKILYALELGFEVGLPPLAAVQSIAVINGRASLYGDVMLGLVMASGKFDEEAFTEQIEEDDKGFPVKATCTVRRLPNGKPSTGSFSYEEAKLAGLAGKEGPWRNYPRRMLQMRARGFALRDAFPDVLKGIISREEAHDLPPEKNITASATATTKPTSLEELTDQMNGSASEAAPVAEASTETAPTNETPAGVVEEVKETVPAADDGLGAVRHQLALCTTVPDVTRYRNSLTGPASKLTELEKSSINQICDARAQEIRAARSK